MCTICSKVKITSSKVYDDLRWCYKFSLLLLQAFFLTACAAWTNESCTRADSQQDNSASREAGGSTESADVTYAEINSWGLSAAWIYLHDIVYLWLISVPLQQRGFKLHFHRINLPQSKSNISFISAGMWALWEEQPQLFIDAFFPCWWKERNSLNPSAVEQTCCRQRKKKNESCFRIIYESMLMEGFQFHFCHFHTFKKKGGILS